MEASEKRSFWKATMRLGKRLISHSYSLFILHSAAAESSAKVKGAKNGCRHGGWQGQEEEVVQGKGPR